MRLGMYVPQAGLVSGEELCLLVTECWLHFVLWYNSCVWWLVLKSPLRMVWSGLFLSLLWPESPLPPWRRALLSLSCWDHLLLFEQEPKVPPQQGAVLEMCLLYPRMDTGVQMGHQGKFLHRGAGWSRNRLPREVLMASGLRVLGPSGRCS